MNQRTITLVGMNDTRIIYSADTWVITVEYNCIRITNKLGDLFKIIPLHQIKEIIYE